jgi:RNA polymerase-associated protein RTF1
MQMSEVEREAILAQRHDEMQQAVDKRNLNQMLKGQAAGLGRFNEEDNVSKAAKRVLNLVFAILQD